MIEISEKEKQVLRRHTQIKKKQKRHKTAVAIVSGIFKGKETINGGLMRTAKDKKPETKREVDTIQEKIDTETPTFLRSMLLSGASKEG